MLVEVVEQRCAWPGVAFSHFHPRVQQCAHQCASPLAPQDGTPDVHVHVHVHCMFTAYRLHMHTGCALHAHKTPSRSPAASSSSAYASIPIGPSAALDSAASWELRAKSRGGIGGGGGRGVWSESSFGHRRTRAAGCSGLVDGVDGRGGGDGGSGGGGGGGSGSIVAVMGDLRCKTDDALNALALIWRCLAAVAAALLEHALVLARLANTLLSSWACTPARPRRSLSAAWPPTRRYACCSSFIFWKLAFALACNSLLRHM